MGECGGDGKRGRCDVLLLLLPRKGLASLTTYVWLRPNFLCLHGYPEMMEGETGSGRVLFWLYISGPAGGEECVVGE